MKEKDKVEEELKDEANADINVRIDTVSPKIPNEILGLGEAIHLFNKGPVGITHVEIEADEQPPRFIIEGFITRKP